MKLSFDVEELDAGVALVVVEEFAQSPSIKENVKTFAITAKRIVIGQLES